MMVSGCAKRGGDAEGIRREVFRGTEVLRETRKNR
jgi:hypothetical protein